jgi:hypothetical protein
MNGEFMKIINPILARQVAKAMKPRNPVLAALRDRRGGAGAHVKSRGALRREENMAIAREMRALRKEEPHA